ncbi:MAG: radical SAM protein [Bacillota bacterium]|nr:radical SAM protein [Bacillota bacterium]
MEFDSVKKIAAEFALERVINFIARDPEHNLPLLFNFIEKVAIAPGHKSVVKKIKAHIHGNGQIMEQTKRIACNPKMLHNIINSWIINGFILGNEKRKKISSEIGVSVPQFLLIDPTSACNLRCEGCWAGEYSKVDHLEPELFSRIIMEAKELGIHWIVLSGGEPFCYPHLLDVAAEHPDIVFMVYTNGTLIDEKTADRMAELANISPAFSLEGWREQTDARRGKGTFDKVTHAMDLLRERGVFFGASLTSMRNNIIELFSDEFVDFLVEKGVIYTWFFHYIPIGRNPNIELMLTPEQRLWMLERVREIRITKPILIGDFWNDGEFTGGCIAGGRLYFHINAAGDVEPCAFVHFAVDNIREKSLLEVLHNPLFKAYQKEHPFNKNHLAPCPIIDSPAALRKMVKESGAHPTHQGAEHVLGGEVAKHLDLISGHWLKMADEFKEASLAEEEVIAGK